MYMATLRSWSKYFAHHSASPTYPTLTAPPPALTAACHAVALGKARLGTGKPVVKYHEFTQFLITYTVYLNFDLLAIWWMAKSIFFLRFTGPHTKVKYQISYFM